RCCTRKDRRSGWDTRNATRTCPWPPRSTPQSPRPQYDDAAPIDFHARMALRNRRRFSCPKPWAVHSSARMGANRFRLMCHWRRDRGIEASRRCARKHRLGGNIQAPSAKHQGNTKFQIPGGFSAGGWDLELFWCLALGAWCFLGSLDKTGEARVSRYWHSWQPRPPPHFPNVRQYGATVVAPPQASRGRALHGGQKRHSNLSLGVRQLCASITSSM